MNKWYEAASSSDIVVSTRIRLARNLKGIPFPNRMTPEQILEVNDRVKQAVFSGNSVLGQQLKCIEIGALSQIEANAMVERHIISPAFAENREGKILLLSEDESISIMICEEDHIRIQVIKAGLSLESAYDIADKIDTVLSENLEIAFSEKLGYLTECTTNLGTGLRASVMMHLPALESNKRIAHIADTVSKIGLTVRGLYGEGSRSQASLYQFSNQVTLGITEKTALDNLKTIIGQITAKEEELRGHIDRIRLEDMAFRAYGLLKSSRIIDTAELMNLLSRIKLGISEKILTEIEPSLPIKLIIEAQPAMLQKLYGEMDYDERDIKRAEFIRKNL